VPSAAKAIGQCPTVMPAYKAYADGVSYRFTSAPNCILEVGETLTLGVDLQTSDKSRARGGGFAQWTVIAGDPAGLAPGNIFNGNWPNIDSSWPRFGRSYSKSGRFTASLPGTYTVRASIDFPYATYVPFANKNFRTTLTYTVQVLGFPRGLVGTTQLSDTYSFRDYTGAWLEDGTIQDRAPESFAIKIHQVNADKTVSVSLTELVWDAATASWQRVLCMGTTAFTATFVNNDTLVSGPALSTQSGHEGGHFPLGQKSTPIHGMSFTATLNAARTGFASVTLTYGTVDDRWLSPLTGGSLCAFLASYGSSCSMCPSGDSMTCVTPVIDVGPSRSVVAPEISAVSVNPAEELPQCFLDLRNPLR
jgi:hypothetical protein